MTELKTLKEITGFYSSDCDEWEAHKDFANKIKTEAVKWVKKLQQMIKDEVYNTEKLSSNLDIFMEFFNLTEEDLEEKEE